MHREQLAAAVMLLWGAFALAPGALLAQKDVSGTSIAERRSSLQDVQARIRELQREIARSEESRDDALESLRDAEQAISASQRHLRELATNRVAAEGELRRVADAGRRLEDSIRAQQGALERLLNRYYLSGQAQGLRHMLSGSDPNQLARDLYYLKQLSRSEADLIGRLRASLAEQKALLDEARQTRDALAEIETEQKRELAQLAEQQKKRRSMLAELSEKLRVQRREVGNLKRDEARLTRLIDGLAELARKQAVAAEKVHRQAQLAEEKRRQQEATARGAAETKSPPPAEPPLSHADRAPESSRKEPPSVSHVEQPPQAHPGDTPFAQLRGKLRLPVRGELMNRFGSPRADGRSSWRGVFIRAGTGGEVKAVAAGRIAFADWLRGFGNLVIVDHGDDFMSIYGYNESVLKAVGETVRAGDAIASVGNSGGSEESGLYFELRHRGQPIDPMRWVSLR